HTIAEIPEIVDQIIWHLSAYQDPNITQASILHYNKKHLHPCLFVNRLWYSCAVRHIWRHVLFEDSVHDSYAFQKFASIFSNTQMAIPKPPSSSFSSSLFSFLSTDLPALTAPPSTQLPPLPNHPTKLSTPSLSIYNKAIRSLTIRKLKDRSLNSMLNSIAQYATRLTNIDFYICDHLSNDALMSLFRYACSSLTHVSLAGCYRISDESIIMLAHYVPGLIYLDLRACGSISDVSITAIATSCPHLKHLNVGRIRERDRITSQSIIKIAECTQVTVLGLAGCAIDDQAIIQLATYRHHTLERVSVNNCQRLTNKSLRYLFNHCPNLTVFEMKDCHYITDWYIVHDLLTRNVILTLSEQQNKEYREWCDR
ncbi:hypothetical protein BJ944DRAFT_149690, partial [Cunninghamella echinulata]